MSHGWALLLACFIGICLGQERRQMGFVGVRGKKDSIDLEENKRAPPLGFMGVRGKKENDYPWPMDITEDKRAPGYGFFGVRGKKVPSPMGFYGVRGKKAPNTSAFYGMRGKKAPQHFGFTAVRGKKDNNDEDLESLLQMLKESAAKQEIEEMMESRVKRFASTINSLEDYQLPQAELL